MKILRRRLLVVLLLGLALIAGGCGGDDDGAAGGDDGDDGGSRIVVGSADFAESEIAANLYAQALEAAGYDVQTRFGIGAREVYFAALESGEVDLVPEFVSSLTVYLGEDASSDTEEGMEALRSALPESIVALEPSPAESRNVFVVTGETAEEHGLSAVSDLEGKEGDLTLGGPPECPERDFCLLGLKEVYNVDLASGFRPLDVGGPITKEALSSGEIDVALLFSTDGAIVENDWVILEDDKQLQNVENLVPVGRERVLDDEARDILNDVSAALDDDAYRELVRRVVVDKDDPDAVAQEWLEDNGFLE